MTHYPPSKIHSDIKSPMQDVRTSPGKPSTPTSPGDSERRTFAEGVDTGDIQPGKTQGANLP